MFKNVKKILDKRDEVDIEMESKKREVNVTFEVDGIKINKTYFLCPICSSLLIEERWEGHKRTEKQLGIDSIEEIQKARRRFFGKLEQERREKENADSVKTNE